MYLLLLLIDARFFQHYLCVYEMPSSQTCCTSRQLPSVWWWTFQWVQIFMTNLPFANILTLLLFLFQISCFSGSFFSQCLSTQNQNGSLLFTKINCNSLSTSFAFQPVVFVFLSQSKLFHGLCCFCCFHTQLSGLFVCYSMMVFAPAQCTAVLWRALCVWVCEWSCVPPWQQQTVVTPQDAWREA